MSIPDSFKIVNNVRLQSIVTELSVGEWFNVVLFEGHMKLDFENIPPYSIAS